MIKKKSRHGGIKSGLSQKWLIIGNFKKSKTVPFQK